VRQVPHEPEPDGAVLLPDLRASFEAFLIENLERLETAVLRWDSGAGDALQDALLQAYQQWETVSTAKSPIAYVFGMARHVRLNELRRDRRRNEVPTGFTTGEAGQADFTDLVVAADQLWDAVRRLPCAMREVFVLRDVVGFSEAEAAEILEVAGSTVRGHLCRARAALRKLLTDQRRGGRR
jgi:RNA polymerase sigma-70 factor (ECF subfamily)